ncbi:glycoside hydrolase [Lindgomyces ingoldianus]|uniref:Glycoside hydrolase n=1 Tax=Lindgomyces ingoldianus TaxID=673940 RepID=A0ACB6QKI5_9PLEO|nr:glycoside hydrolase [Lindgomyces ingoldianus]KAF2466656.1 glycoside hydrolase [Lindgomyces ingoldianus]
MQSDNGIPRLSKIGSTWQLLVDEKPYLILGGQVQNSSFNSAEYMKPIWGKLTKMGINTVIGPVAWEDIEPEEGSFQFSDLDAIMADARSHGLRLILLWFGSFKNGMSTYVPSWVKKDASRFPRVQIESAQNVLRTVEVISVFHQQCVEADGKAFAALMRHLKESDLQRTVIMVQVENECGIIGDSRDRSYLAEAAFQAPVPPQLIDFLVQNWSTLHADFTRSFPAFCLERMSRPANDWKGCFGQSARTDELFMAHHYALYIEKIAAVGKEQYPLPHYINAWLPKPDDTPKTEGLAAGGHKPGVYPSGGATNNMLDIWEQFAPSVDFIAPDIYTADYTETCMVYGSRKYPFFVPEQRRDSFGARRITKAIGSFRAIGVAPFGVDTIKVEDCAFSKLYRLLGSVSNAILAAQTRPNAIFGFFFDQYSPPADKSHPRITKQFAAYELVISRAFVLGQPGTGSGIIIELDPSRFLIVGMGFKVEFKSLSAASRFTGILTCMEKRVIDAERGVLESVRKLNGDETKGGTWCNMPNEVPDYGDQFIPMCIPAGTMITEVEVYSLG